MPKALPYAEGMNNRKLQDLVVDTHELSLESNSDGSFALKTQQNPSSVVITLKSLRHSVSSFIHSQYINICLHEGMAYK